MNSLRALSLLRGLRVTAFTTANAAARLALSIAAASQTLARLADAGLVRRLRRGLWTLQEELEPMALLDHVSSPQPAYVSLQSALRHHGMIEQIPSLTYAVSLGRSRRVRTSVGTFSLHRMSPVLFGGFEVIDRQGSKLATPEKALFDLLYLSGGRSRVFAALPELTLPPGFRPGLVETWIRRIPSSRLRTLVRRRFAQCRARLDPASLRGRGAVKRGGRRGA